MIEVEGLTKRYGLRTAVDGISFSVDKGEIVGFLGPNGAGKSTTLRMLTGFLAPSAGAIRIDGIDMLEKPIEAQRRIGYMPEACPLYPEMRVVEYLRYRAELKGVPSRDLAKRVGQRRERLGLAGCAGDSGQRVGAGARIGIGICGGKEADHPAQRRYRVVNVFDLPPAAQDEVAALCDLVVRAV